MSDPRGPETITKKELVNRIAETTGQTKVVVKDILQRFLDEIIDELSVGNRLEFREFGVFEVRRRAARQAQNPRTLERVHVPSKRVVKFKVGRTMRERVCGQDGPGGPDDYGDVPFEHDAGGRPQRRAEPGSRPQPVEIHHGDGAPSRPKGPATDPGSPF